MSSRSDPPQLVSLAVNGASDGADGGGGAGAAQAKPEPGSPPKRSNSMFVAFTIGVAVRKMQANFRGRRAQKAMQLLKKSKSFKHLHKSMGLGSGGPTRRTSQQYKSLWKRGITQVIDANKEDLEDEALSEEKIKAATLAAYYVEDAFAGRLSNGKAVMSGRDAFTFRCFNIHVHKNWTFTIIGANLLHTALIALERPRTFYGSALPYPGLALVSAALEWGCLGVYVADVALKSFYQGVATFFSYDSGKKWQLIYGVFVVWMIVDALVMAGSDADGGFRFSRPIRPVVMLLRSRAIRRFYTVVVDMIPAFMRVCIPIVFFLLAFATFAARLMAHTGVAKHDSLFTSSLASYHTFFVLLMTCDNYSPVQDAFVSSHSFFGRAAFFMFLVVGVLFLVSLVLGVTFDAYTEHTKKQVKDEHMKELYGLTKAFATIDVDKTGEVNVPQFIQLMLTLRSDLSKFECHFLFDVLAGFDGVIDFIDFYGMRKVLAYHFLESEAKRRDKNKQALLQSPSAAGRALRYVNKSMAGGWFSNTQELLCVVDCAALLLDVEQYVLVSFGSSGYALTLGDAVGITLLVELMLKVLLGGGIRLYWFGRGTMQFHPRTRAARRVDATLVLMSTLHLWFPWTHAIFGVKFSWAVWRVWRSTIFVHTLGVFFRCFLQILPVLMQVSTPLLRQRACSPASLAHARLLHRPYVPLTRPSCAPSHADDRLRLCRHVYVRRHRNGVHGRRDLTL